MSVNAKNPSLFYNTHLHVLKDKQRHRVLSCDEAMNPAYDFSHNDYLGLSRHPALIKAAQQAAHDYGVGSRGSQLLSGYGKLNEDVSAMIARDKGYEACMLFPSGYQANAAIIQALLHPSVLRTPPLVFADRSLHASLHAGFQAVRVRQIRYHHLDLGHLSDLLEAHAHVEGPRFIVTESVFGMEGDVVDMPAITALSQRHKAFLYVDEAHATGVMGAHGYGVTEGFADSVDLSMGTFSKGLGCSGAYACMSSALKDYLVNMCSGFIYSTGPSPMVLAAAGAAWGLLPSLHAERARLQSLKAYLCKGLHQMGYQVGGDSRTPILALYLGESGAVLSLRDHLARLGFRVSAIRPPTVPPRKAMIRFSLHVAHTEAVLDDLMRAVALWQSK